MPVSKNALIRYKTIDRCLGNRYRRWTFEDREDGSAVFELRVIVNRELVRLLFGFAEGIRVLRPRKLVHVMRRHFLLGRRFSRQALAAFSRTADAHAIASFTRRVQAHMPPSPYTAVTLRTTAIAFETSGNLSSKRQSSFSSRTGPSSEV